jgi:putative ABC transport system ATP-binding protein
MTLLRSTTPPALRARRVTRSYRMGSVTVAALAATDLDVDAGEMLCITGRSGSGKSTLLRQLSLIDRPTTGRVEVEGCDVARLSERRRAAIRLRRLGYVFQEYALIPSLTARENVALPALMRGSRAAEASRKADAVLGTVGLADLGGRRPKELSGGQQQRVAIARALVNDPAIVFADEATANLDSRSGELVMSTLASLNEDLGVSVMFVSHDPDDQRWATRVLTLSDGAVVGDERRSRA